MVNNKTNKMSKNNKWQNCIDRFDTNLTTEQLCSLQLGTGKEMYIIQIQAFEMKLSS